MIIVKYGKSDLKKENRSLALERKEKEEEEKENTRNSWYTMGPIKSWVLWMTNKESKKQACSTFKIL